MRASALVLLALIGCAARERLEPVHAAVVCPVAGERECPIAERAAAFARWAHDSLRRPGSTFTVWVGDVGGTARREFVACVPESWGPGVMEAKAAFLREGRRQATGGGGSVPAGCVLTAGLAGKVAVLGDGRQWHLGSAGLPRHLAVVCDRSNSMLGQACDAALLHATFDEWLIRSGGAPGSSFDVFGVGASRDGAERLAHVAAGGESAGERVALLLAARRRLATGLDSAPSGSAIAEAVSVAAATLRDRAGERELVILSDLRQVTPGTWNFEVSSPTPEAFAAWLRFGGLSSDLRGVEVRACGLHHQRAPGSPPFDAILAGRVEAVWKRAFDVMGATGARLDGDCAGDASLSHSRGLATR